MRAVLLIAALFALSACGGGRMGMEVLTSYTDGQDPALNEPTEAVYGEVIYSRFQEYVNLGAVTTELFWLKNGMTSMNLPAGTKLIGLRDAQGDAYCTTTKEVIDALIGPRRFACFVDLNNDGAFESGWISDNGVDLFGPMVKSIGVPYRKKLMPVVEGRDFRFELIYQGMTNNTLRLTYREFMGDVISPVISQDLTYGLREAGDTEVRFREARIAVHGVTDGILRYTVLEGLN